MPLIFADRVKESSTTTGTGTLNLDGAVTGFQSFVAGIGNGNTCYYVIADINGAWELGIGTITDAAPDTLARSVVKSSNADALISCSGNETVFCDAPARLFSPKQTMWIPAAAMSPVTTNGCAPIIQIEGTIGRPEQETLDFDGTTLESAQFNVGFPKAWDKGVVNFQYFWTGAAGAGGVVFEMSGVALANDDPIDTVYGTPVEETDTFIAADDIHVSAESGDITIAGSPADDELIYFKLSRDPVAGGDTKSEDAKLLGIKLLFNMLDLTDA